MNISKTEKKGWIISFVGALFFFYAFIQANVLTPISGDISKAFDANASALSFLTAWYFYANIIFIIPAGLMLDRYPIRWLMLITLSICVLGTFMLAYAPDIRIAYIGRFLCGIMMSFGLVSCLKLASLLLPTNKMAIASSLIITIGMIGGVFAHAPIAYLSSQIGWRSSLVVLAFLGILVAAILWFTVKVPKTQVMNKAAASVGIWDSLREVFRNKQNWFAGFFISLINFPVAILGALFGVPYLTQVHGFLYIQAAAITSMIFIGMIFGSPFFGWLSDHMQKRKPPMFMGAISCFVFIFILIYSHSVTVFSAYLLFFLVGFSSACQVLGYPVITECNPPRISGTALSLASLIIMGLGYGLGLPFVGWMLDQTWDGNIIDGISVYSMNSYQTALITLPVAMIIGILMIFLIKETKCQAVYKK